MAGAGFGVTRTQLIYNVKRYLDQDGRQSKFKDNRPGKDWFHAFFDRHPPEIRQRKRSALGKERALITPDPDQVTAWFVSYVEYITSQDDSLLREPSHIYNCDEGGFPLYCKNATVLAPLLTEPEASVSVHEFVQTTDNLASSLAEQKHQYQYTGLSQQQILTTTFCMSATEQAPVSVCEFVQTTDYNHVLHACYRTIHPLYGHFTREMSHC